MTRSVLFFALTVALHGQDSAHWGLQGDYFTGSSPKSLVEKFHSFPEQPDFDAEGFNTGLVRFHASGAPHWAVEFSDTQVTVDGGLTSGPVRQELRGSASVRGAMITRYLNFFTKRYISGGLAFGGGAAHVEANYYRYQVPPGPSVIVERDSRQLVVPIFQAIAQVDVRPVRWVSLSPFYGLRNGALGFGGTIRIHFTR